MMGIRLSRAMRARSSEVGPGTISATSRGRRRRPRYVKSSGSTASSAPRSAASTSNRSAVARLCALSSPLFICTTATFISAPRPRMCCRRNDRNIGRGRGGEGVHCMKDDFSVEDVARYWDENAAGWAEQVRRGADVAREWLNNPAFLAFVGDQRGRRVLDAGCGEGYNTRILA